MHISRLKNVYDTNPLSYPIDVIHKEIVSGQTSISNCHDDFKYKRLSDYTEYARELRRHKYKSSAYHRVKCSLPQMCPAGILNGRHEVKEFSGLVCLDFDDVNTDYAYLASLAFQHPSVYAFFRSLSNKLKIIFLVDKQGLDANTYKHAYIKASDVFSHIAIADKSSALPTHLQGYCYDSQSYLNTSAIPLSWQVNDELAKSFLGKEYNRSITIGNVDGLDLEYRLAIEDMMFDESGWGNTNVPCTQKEHSLDGWHSNNNGTSICDLGDKILFHCFKGCGSYIYHKSVPVVTNGIRKQSYLRKSNWRNNERAKRVSNR